MSEKIQYFNKHGKAVELTITPHARFKFQSRWLHMFPKEPLTLENVDAKIAKWFSHADRVINLSRKDRTRMERHGKDTIFFRSNMFTFIVQNATIVTIEISDYDKRYLNKRSKPVPQMLKSCW